VVPVIQLDRVVGVRGTVHEVPEAVYIRWQIRGVIHCHDCAASALEQVVIGREHAGLDEDRLRTHMVELRRMFVPTIAQVAEREGRLLFEDGRKVQEAEVIVVQDEQRRIALAELQPMYIAS